MQFGQVFGLAKWTVIVWLTWTNRSGGFGYWLIVSSGSFNMYLKQSCKHRHAIRIHTKPGTVV